MTDFSYKKLLEGVRHLKSVAEMQRGKGKNRQVYLAESKEVAEMVKKLHPYLKVLYQKSVGVFEEYE